MILHILLAFLTCAQATSFYIPPFSDFTSEANLIVRGTFSNINVQNAVSDNGTKIIYTYATLDVKELLKGNNAQSSLLIRKLGGSKDGYNLVIPGSPDFKEGEDEVLFLSAEKEDHSYEVLSLELGQYHVQDKNGQPTLAGGIFNYPQKGEHNGANAQAENAHAWTLQDLRALIEKEGGKLAPVKAIVPVAASPSPENSAKFVAHTTPSASLDANSEPTDKVATYYVWVYLSMAVGFVCMMIFLFRKP
jgi:hypothetical protein